MTAQPTELYYGYPIGFDLDNEALGYAILGGTTLPQVMLSLATTLPNAAQGVELTVVAAALNNDGSPIYPQQIRIKVLGFMSHPHSTKDLPQAILECCVHPEDISKVGMQRTRMDGGKIARANVGYFGWQIQY